METKINKDRNKSNSDPKGQVRTGQASHARHRPFLVASINKQEIQIGTKASLFYYNAPCWFILSTTAENVLETKGLLDLDLSIDLLTLTSFSSLSYHFNRTRSIDMYQWVIMYNFLRLYDQLSQLQWTILFQFLCQQLYCFYLFQEHVAPGSSLSKSQRQANKRE